MARSVDQTKDRIVEAATAEFSRHGIAGARVDRIVAAAGCGKGLVYNYFGSKDLLFDEVYHRLVTEAVEAVEFSADDLPGYAVALYDHVRDNPVVARLTTWHQLERGPSPDPVAQASNQRKRRALSEAQRNGTVDSSIPPAHLLDMIVALAMMGAGATTDGARLKESLRHTVEKMVAPTHRE
ncbi:TetR family transcriptional regulator [Actinoplanes sp. NPDC049596]|uniref:TetR family transcriptional regulator n=1 Tax=unclassified Actinoplanes TaxID=2626549 RepID=UPI00341B9D2B